MSSDHDGPPTPSPEFSCRLGRWCGGCTGPDPSVSRWPYAAPFSARRIELCVRFSRTRGVLPRTGPRGVSAYYLSWSQRWAEFPKRKYAAQPRRTWLTSATTVSTANSQQQPMPVRKFTDTPSDALQRLVQGQSARNWTCPARCERARTHRCWKPRKSKPSPPSSRCTIRSLTPWASVPDRPRDQSAWRALRPPPGVCGTSKHQTQQFRQRQIRTPRTLTPFPAAFGISTARTGGGK